jgi:hypothetical protein
MSKVVCMGVLATIGWTSTAAAQGTPQPLQPVPEPPTLSPVPPPPPPPPGGMYSPPPVPARPPFERRGFVVGFAVGGGYEWSSFDGANAFGGLAFEFHLGGMLTPMLAAMVDFGTISRWIGYSDRLSVNSTMFALQFWPHKQVWLKLGGGIGYLAHANTWDGYLITSGVGGMLGGAVGVELLQQRNFAVDLQVRYTADFFENLTASGVAFMLGVSWY